MGTRKPTYIYPLLREQAKQLRPMLTFTFDDGTKDHYTTVMPALRDAGMRGTFFVPSDYVDTAGYLTTAQTKEMADIGHEIASHGKQHVAMAGLSDADKITECTASKAALEAITDKPVETIAYPGGSYNAAVLNLASSCFFAGRVTVGGYVLYNRRSMMDLRCAFVSSRTLVQTKAYCSALLTNPPAWLVLAFHRVTAGGGADIWTTADFQALVAYVDGLDVDVVTFAEGARRIKNGQSYNLLMNPECEPDYAYAGAGAYYTRGLGYSHAPQGAPETEPIRFPGDSTALITHSDVGSTSVLYQTPETVVGQDYVLEVDAVLTNVAGTGFGIRAWELGSWAWQTGTKTVHLTKAFTATSNAQQVRFQLSGSGSVVLSNPLVRLDV